MALRSLFASPRTNGIITLMIGFVFTVGGFLMKWKEQKLERSGITTSGTILRGWVHDKHRRRESHHLEVTYCAEGSVWQRSFSTHRVYYSKHMNEAEKVTQPEVQVRYQRSYPLNAILVEGSKDGNAALWAGVVGLGIGAALLAFAAVRKQRRLAGKTQMVIAPLSQTRVGPRWRTWKKGGPVGSWNPEGSDRSQCRRLTTR